MSNDLIRKDRRLQLIASLQHVERCIQENQDRPSIRENPYPETVKNRAPGGLRARPPQRCPNRQPVTERLLKASKNSRGQEEDKEQDDEKHDIQRLRIERRGLPKIIEECD